MKYGPTFGLSCFPLPKISNDYFVCFASSVIVVFITLPNECVAMSDSGVIALLTCLSSVVVNTIEATTRTALKKLKQNKILNNKNHEVCRIAAEQ